jgi:hypothetical protein
MKKCTKCETYKPYGEFGVRNDRHANIRGVCKQCINNSQILLNRSIDGKLRSIYKDQYKRSKRKWDSSPTYTREEFIEYWINNPLYVELYTNWVNSDYDKLLAPSIDRLDNSLGYSFENTQLVTWKENKDKEKVSIVMISVDGIETNFDSIIEASRQTDIGYDTIRGCLRRGTPTRNGINFRYN